jgi:HD-GYP domain-containing protein (c-di-GMP phosphodiesterase class II)
MYKKLVEKRIAESEKTLNSIQDIDVLMERLLTEARKIAHADAGSIYEVINNNTIRIKYSQNDTQQQKLISGKKLPYQSFCFPLNKSSMAGYSVLKNEIINVPDAYKLGNGHLFKFNPDPDKKSGYKTKSILTIPLVTEDGVKLGVFQIINALDDDNTVIEFTSEMEQYMKEFAFFANQALLRARKTKFQIMRQIAMAEMRDPKETGVHVERVSSCALEIYDCYASEHNISEIEREKFRDNLKIAAVLHDVGKVGIPDEVLHFPGRFEGESLWMRDVINTHTALGARLFYPPQDALDEMCLEVALHHQAKWDGSGYPGKIDMSKVDINDGTTMVGGEPLRGTDIPLSARIVCLCDVYDALSHKRSYKSAWNEEKVLSIIKAESGSHFDPELVGYFFKVIDRLRAINKVFADDDE